MAEIKFVVIQARPFITWLAEGKLTPNDLDACLFVLSGERQDTLANIPSWAKEEYPSNEAAGDALAKQVLAALAKAEIQRRLGWRKPEVTLASGIDAFSAPHGIASIIAIYVQARADRRILGPHSFKAKYGLFSPITGVSGRSIERALQTKHPGIRVVH